jgi:hypothetical protein
MSFKERRQRDKLRNSLKKQTWKGFRGYPVATGKPSVLVRHGASSHERLVNIAIRLLNDIARIGGHLSTSIFVAVLAVAAPEASAETAWVPSSETACAIEGWAVDIDPKGLNVRAAPGKNAPVVGTLPPYVRGEHDVGVEVKIIGSRDGWLRITSAKDLPDLTELPPRKTYSGEGWVHDSRIRFAIQSGVGWQRPDNGSAQRIRRDGWLTNGGEITQVLACQDKWALVDYKLQEAQGRAWFRGICSNQVTTCEGVDPDHDPIR